MALNISTALQNTLVDPLAQFVNSFVVTIPGLVAAILLVFFGYVVGMIVGKFAQQLLEKIKLDEYIEKLAKVHPLGKVTVAELGGKLVKWYLVIAFVATAAQLVQLNVIAMLLTGFAVWAPHLIAAVILMALGMFVAELAKKEISGFKSEGSKLLGFVAKYFILVYFAVLALREVGLNLFLAEATLLVVIAGIMLTLAIGFGLALKDHADEFFGELKKAVK